MRRNGDHRGSARRSRRRRRVAPRRLRRDAGAGGRAVLDDVRDRERAALLARLRRGRLRPGSGLSRGFSVHARRLSVDVSRPAVDDAAVRGLRGAGGDERAVPVSARARPDGAFDGFRHADADGLRLGSSAVARRGRARGRGGRLARGHGGAVRRDSARRGLDVDDDQLAGGDAARVLRVRGRGAGRAARGAPREPFRRTSSRSTSRRRSGSFRRSRRCGWSWT